MNKIAINVGKYVGATLDKRMEDLMSGIEHETLLQPGKWEELVRELQNAQRRDKMRDLGRYLEDEMHAYN